MFQALKMKRAYSRLGAEERAILEKPWVHKIRTIDLWNSPQSEDLAFVQLETQGGLFLQLRDAVLRAPKHAACLQLTDSDALFGMYALYQGVGTLRVVDVCGHVPGHEEWHLDQARIAAQVAGRGVQCRFDRVGVTEIEGHYSVGICANVLENLADPAAALVHLRKVVVGSLVIHSVTPLANVAEFMEVGPGVRPWGSRFSHDALIAMVVEAGWSVVNENYKHLPMDWPGDRKLTFLHCV